MPDKIMTNCPHCKTHTEHKVKLYKKGKTRADAVGQKRHVEKTKGYTSKIAGKVTVYKQAKNPTVMLTCTKCNKKRPKTIGTRTKKPLELIKG